jgi:hypothetical protein
MTKNCYPNLPIVPYKRTSIDMDSVIAHIKSTNYSNDVKRSVYTLFRIESGNGKSGVNNNYIGLQTDNARWEDEISEKIISTCFKIENMTGKERGFACFESFKDSIDILEFKVVDRGLFIGGKSHPYSNMNITNVEDLSKAYTIEWVTGDPAARPSSDEMKDFKSIYSQACLKFN